jgi:type IV pilus assembly protein PilC
MPTFSYEAKNKDGEVETGESVFSSKGELVDQLRKRGFWPVVIEEIELKKAKSSFFGGFIKVSLKSRMIFCRHLAVMIGSGLSLSKALNILSTQERNKSFKAVIEKIALDVKKGITFADSMQKYPKVFDSVFVSMVRMGELSGNLEEILLILSEQLEKDHKLVSKVRGAMIYPSVIIVVMIIIGFLMMTFVIPKITVIFKEFGAELPLLTRIVINMSDFMAANSILTIAIAIISVVSIQMFYKTNAGQKFFHKLFLKAPVLGAVITKVNSARFSRILSSLLSSGTSLVEALKITSDTLGNYYYKKACSEAAQKVQKGIELSRILKEGYQDVFPYLVIQMMEVGEETGKTPEILKKLAYFYEEEVDQITKNLSSIIEPILMVVIGSAVGLFAIAIISPIYSVMSNI